MKKQDKEVKVSVPKKTKDFRKGIDKVFQVIAHVAIIALATYGLRMFLRNIDERAAVAFTVIVVAFLVHTMYAKK